MILRTKAIPMDARDAMGYRRKRGDRSCFFCGLTEENNFDEFGKLQMLTVKSVDKNFANQLVSNHIYVCSNPSCKANRK